MVSRVAGYLPIPSVIKNISKPKNIALLVGAGLGYVLVSPTTLLGRAATIAAGAAAAKIIFPFLEAISLLPAMQKQIKFRVGASILAKYSAEQQTAAFQTAWNRFKSSNHFASLQEKFGTKNESSLRQSVLTFISRGLGAGESEQIMNCIQQRPNILPQNIGDSIRLEEVFFSQMKELTKEGQITPIAAFSQHENLSTYRRELDHFLEENPSQGTFVLLFGDQLDPAIGGRRILRGQTIPFQCGNGKFWFYDGNKSLHSYLKGFYSFASKEEFVANLKTFFNMYYDPMYVSIQSQS